MRPARALAVAGALVLAGLTSGTAHAAGPQSRDAGAAESSFSPRGLLDRYCVTCHNQRLQTAGLTLDTLDVGAVAARPEVWEKVVRKLRAGLMPPAGRASPPLRTSTTTSPAGSNPGSTGQRPPIRIPVDRTRSIA